METDPRKLDTPPAALGRPGLDVSSKVIGRQEVVETTRLGRPAE